MPKHTLVLASLCQKARSLRLDCDEIIVLLAALHEQVFAVNQVLLGDNAVESGELFLVQADTAALRELAHFAL